MLLSTPLVIAIATALVQSKATELVSFDGQNGTTFAFQEMEDPVMGSRSGGNWTVDGAGGFGVLDGVVTIVERPAVSIVGASPGFVKAAATGPFADASDNAAGDLILVVRSSTPDYTGFHVSFAAGAHAPGYSCEGGGHIPFSRGCFKAKFCVPPGSEFTPVHIPFASFSDLWKPATGEQTTTCADDKSVCPTASLLKKIQRIELWAEGANGKVHLEVKSISAGTKPTSEQLVV